MSYSVPTLKKLFALCGNECAYPGCTAPIVDDDSGIVVGEISHIKGKSPQGPRYDPNQTSEERNGYENLLLMCDPHNKIIDHEDTRDKFPVDLLREFKTKHESKFRRSLTDKRDPSRIDFNLVNQELMNNFVSHFLNVEGSVINSENQMGGQTAHQITNYYFGRNEPVAAKGRRKPKGRKQSNLQFRGIEYPKLFLENDIFWEAPHAEGVYAYPCAVLRYCNELIPGQAGQPIKGLRAVFQFRSSDRNSNAPIDHGTWVRERYNSIDLAVGSCRMLVIVWRSQPAIKAFAFAPVDHHYSDKAYDRMYFMPLKELPVEVEVTLLAGDGGYLMDQRTLRVEIEPELRLTIKVPEWSSADITMEIADYLTNLQLRKGERHLIRFEDLKHLGLTLNQISENFPAAVRQAALDLVNQTETRATVRKPAILIA
jgi:hypothetical protein